MSEIHVSYGNSFVPKSDEASPTRTMMQIIEDNPRASLQKRIDIFIEEALADPDLNRAALKAEAINVHQNCIRAREKNLPPRKLKKIKEEKIAARKQIETRAAVAVRCVQSIWLSNVMASTFGELAKVGGQFAKLAKMGKPSQRVSDVLTEAQVSKLLK